MHLQLVRLGTLYFLCKASFFFPFAEERVWEALLKVGKALCTKEHYPENLGGQSAFGGLQGAALLLLPSYDPAALPFDASELTARNRKYLSIWYLLSQYGSMATGFEEGTQLPQRQRWDPKQTT